MKIKILVALVLFIQFPIMGFAQTKPSVNANAEKIISEQKSGQDQLKYVDSTYGYSVVVAKWWDIKETPSANFFGGTFPEINNSKGALLFKSFEKDTFKTFQNFENWVVAGYRSGETPRWSNEHKFLYKKNLDQFKSIGKAYKVQLKADDSFYNCCYIIVETTKSFLWIDLTSTRETYDANFKELEKLMLEFTAF
ncbi:hypothetical protein [Gelidibacter pelagius]|uniref:Uncharacterized protein n=1 Tax=Gelidibacter pelagius TaxID=2819985 RepID=A0ABS3SU09_9FLAO|nr:hypothetical protein [Gelidibacter pelagius]MBO3098911.1 hypothetical protein [Gelidibacter pelagius]